MRHLAPAPYKFVSISVSRAFLQRRFGGFQRRVGRQNHRWVVPYSQAPVPICMILEKESR
jgi:hypothetical protein